MSTIDGMFDRVTFDGEDRQYNYNLHIKVKEMAADLDKNAPDCAEKTLAFRSLHLFLMHAEIALGKKTKYRI